MKQKITQILMVLWCLLAGFMGFSQVTTSSISGIVKQTNGEALVGATVKATHTPTGTVYTTKATNGGRYYLANVQAGGPYTVEVTFVGFTKQIVDEVNLNLGETGKVDFILADDSKEISEKVVVTAARRQLATAKGGMETIIGVDRLENAPTVGRQLTDFIRLTPQARVTTNGGISIAGQNNRYNQIMFDGAVNNDVFGLSETGTNGGQTGSSPISIDAIESFQVGVSPYDVALGNFTGGSVNAVTKSGTNKVKGTAYYIVRNEGLAGKTPTGEKSAAMKLPDFSNTIIGGTIGFPIIKNKLFLFGSFEVEDGERPQPFDPTTFRNQAFRDTINLIQNRLRQFGYETGDWENIPDLIKSTKIATKLTYNINSKHRLNLSYRYTNSERSLTSPSTTTQIRFFNNGYLFPSTTHSASGELTSSFSSKASNKLLLTYTNVLDDRNPLGNPFPRVTLNSLNGTSYVFGTEEFSTANQLKQDNFALFNEFKYNLGKHQLKAGLDIEYSKSYNLFIRQAYGSYTYLWANDWLTDARPNRYDRSFSLVDDKVGDGSAAAAQFNTLRFGAFIGDQWDVTNNFQLNFGVRFDNFEFLTTPKEDAFFNRYALGQINAVNDTRGIRSGARPNPNLAVSPRIGFTYNVPELDVKIRGGIGVFTGRVPLVWPGGAYNNTGVSIGGIGVNQPNITFRPDVNNQWTPQELGATVRVPSGQLDFIDPNFKLPSVLKTSLGFDKTLKGGWKLTVEGLWQSNINEIDYQNVMGRPGLVNAFGQQTYWQSSSRNYSAVDMDPRTPGTQNPYATGIFIVTNTKNKDKGYSYNFNFSIDKSFRKGFTLNVTYGYGDSWSVFDGTSSQNNSQWRFMEAANGRNNLQRNRSDFASLHRINAYVSKKFSYAKGALATIVTLFYNGQSGSPYSYTFFRSLIGDNNGSQTESQDLVYVPRDLADWRRFAIPYTANNQTVSVEQQWESLDAYITNSKHLNNRRGQFAERNGSSLPMSHIIDARVQQDFVLKTGNIKNRFAVVFDIFNLTNMIDRTWGRVYRTPGVDQFTLINFEGYNASMVPQMTYRNIGRTSVADIQDVQGSVYNVTRWRGQFTLRYYFN